MDKKDEPKHYEVTIKDLKTNQILDTMQGHMASIFVATNEGVDHGGTGHHPDTSLPKAIMTELKMTIFTVEKLLYFMDSLPDMGLGDTLFQPFKLNTLREWSKAVQKNINTNELH